MEGCEWTGPVEAVLNLFGVALDFRWSASVSITGLTAALPLVAHLFELASLCGNGESLACSAHGLGKPDFLWSALGFGELPLLGSTFGELALCGYLGELPLLGSAFSFGEPPLLGSALGFDELPLFGSTSTFGFGSALGFVELPLFGSAFSLGELLLLGSAFGLGELLLLGPTLGLGELGLLVSAHRVGIPAFLVSTSLDGALRLPCSLPKSALL